MDDVFGFDVHLLRQLFDRHAFRDAEGFEFLWRNRRARKFDDLGSLLGHLCFRRLPLPDQLDRGARPGGGCAIFAQPPEDPVGDVRSDDPFGAGAHQNLGLRFGNDDLLGDSSRMRDRLCRLGSFHRRSRLRRSGDGWSFRLNSRFRLDNLYWLVPGFQNLFRLRLDAHRRLADIRQQLPRYFARCRLGRPQGRRRQLFDQPGSFAIVVFLPFAWSQRRFGDLFFGLLDLYDLLRFGRFLPFLGSGRRRRCLGDLCRFLSRSLRLLSCLLGRFRFLLLFRLRKLGGFRFPLRKDLLADRVCKAQIDGRSRREDVQSESFQLGEYHLILHRTFRREFRDRDLIHRTSDLKTNYCRAFSGTATKKS